MTSLEQTAESTEPDWNLLYERQLNWSRGNHWSGSWRTNQGYDAHESVDGDGELTQEAQSWTEHEERDEHELRAQEMERRVNIPSHGQSTKDFLLDVIRGWLVLQRSGLSESSKKTVLGSTEDTQGRSRIVEALKQLWPDHELLAYDGDHKRDRDRKVRSCVQAEADEWKPETYQKESAMDSAWNVSEPRDAWEQASVDEAGTWEDEDDPFEGSFADEDEEEAFHLAETRLNEALASERNARRTVAQARAIMHDIKSSRDGCYLQGASKKRFEAGKGKGKGQGKDRDSRRQAYGQSSNLSTSQTGTRFHKPMPSSVRPCNVDLAITNPTSVRRFKSTEVTWHMP